MKKIDIEKYENALERVEKVAPTEEFLRKLEVSLLKVGKPRAQVSRLQVWAIAASFALIIAGNIFYLTLEDSTEISAENYNLVPTKSLYNG